MAVTLPPPPPPPPAPPLELTPTAGQPVAAPAPVNPAALQLWIAQHRERSAAEELLARRLAEGALSEADSISLRAVLASLIFTLTSAQVEA